jgi:hypothetical protein
MLKNEIETKTNKKGLKTKKIAIKRINIKSDIKIKLTKILKDAIKKIIRLKK